MGADTAVAEPTGPATQPPSGVVPVGEPAADIAGALTALLNSPLGMLFGRLLPPGVLAEIAQVLDRAVVSETSTRRAEDEARQVLIARAEADRLRAELAEADLRASRAESESLDLELQAATAEVGRLTACISTVRLQLGNALVAVAGPVETIGRDLMAQAVPNDETNPASLGAVVAARTAPLEKAETAGANHSYVRTENAEDPALVCSATPNPVAEKRVAPARHDDATCRAEGRHRS